MCHGLFAAPFPPSLFMQFSYRFRPCVIIYILLSIFLIFLFFSLFCFLVLCNLFLYSFFFLSSFFSFSHFFFCYFCLLSLFPPLFHILFPIIFTSFFTVFFLWYFSRSFHLSIFLFYVLISFFLCFLHSLFLYISIGRPVKWLDTDWTAVVPFFEEGVSRGYSHGFRRPFPSGTKSVTAWSWSLSVEWTIIARVKQEIYA